MAQRAKHLPQVGSDGQTVRQYYAACLQHLSPPCSLVPCRLVSRRARGDTVLAAPQQSKLALLLVGKAWQVAMASPEVQMRITADCLGMGPVAPRLQAAILAAIPALEVTCEMG